MYRHLIILVLLAGVPIAAWGTQRFIVAQAQTEEPVEGLLRLPEVYGEYPCQTFKPQRIDVYPAASSERPSIGTIERVNPQTGPARPDCDEPIVVMRPSAANSTPRLLPFDESGYEFQAAVVYERSGLWFRVALPQGSGWIQRRNPDDFLAYPDALISESFATYLRPGWDGAFWIEPGLGSATRAPDAWQAYRDKEIPLRITGTRNVGGDIWIQIRFETESCGQSLGELPPLLGWIPAHRPSRATSIWFYSRGC